MNETFVELIEWNDLGIDGRYSRRYQEHAFTAPVLLRYTCYSSKVALRN